MSFIHSSRRIAVVPPKNLAMALDYIDKRRDVLKLKKYEPGKFSAERVLESMADRRQLDKHAAKPYQGLMDKKINSA